MSGRSRVPPHGMKGGPPPFRDDLYGMPPPPPPHLLDDVRDLGPPPPFASGGSRGGGGPRPLPPHAHPAAIMEERLAAQYQEIQVLLVDNQRLAATHVALKQEVAAAQQQLHEMSRAVGGAQAERDAQLREVMTILGKDLTDF